MQQIMEIPVQSPTLVFSEYFVLVTVLWCVTLKLYPLINLNTFLNVNFYAYVVRLGFPLWVRGCIFVENPSGKPYLGCHKIRNQTMELQGCMCQENGCNKELKEPSGIVK